MARGRLRLSRRSPPWLTAVVALVTTLAWAASAASPSTEVQAAILSKALKYDRTLPTPADRAQGAVVFETRSAEVNAVIAAWQKVGVTLTPISATGFVEGKATARFAYLMPDATRPDVVAAAIKNGVLTLGADGKAAERGLLAVALVEEDGKPQLLVHLRAVAKQKHDLSAKLLAIARVIR